MTIPIDERSSMVLGGVGGVGSAITDSLSDGEDITHICWPTYRRLTSINGGDLTATFSFTTDVSTAENWFYNYIGRRFEESIGGDPVFSGYIYSMIINYGDITLWISYDSYASHVKVAYRTPLGNSFTTDFVTINSFNYGYKELIFTVGDVMETAQAEAFAVQLLRQSYIPRPLLQDASVGSSFKSSEYTGVAVVEVTVAGWFSRHDFFHHSSTSELSYYLHELIDQMRDGADTEMLGTLPDWGYIPESTYIASAQADNRPVGQRILELNKIQSGVVGCFGKAVLDFYPIPYDTVYTRRSSYPHQGIYFQGSYVPLAAVKPGVVLEFADSSSYQRFRSYDDAFSAPLIEGVEYSIDGLALRKVEDRRTQLAAAKTRLQYIKAIQESGF